MHILGGRLRRVFVGLTTVAAVLAVGGAPAESLAPPLPTPPEVTITDSGSFTAIYRDCDGTEIDVFTYGYASFERTIGAGVDDSEMDVPVTYGGSLAPSLTYSDATAFFDAGSDYTEVSFELPDATPGAVTVTIDAPAVDALYTVGDPATVEVTVPQEDDILDCNDPLPVDDDEAEQTIEVGETPEGFEILEDFVGGPVDEIPQEILDQFSTPTEGALPPGLTYTDDAWSGKATTPGTYPFKVRLCAATDGIIGDTATAEAVPEDFRAHLPQGRAYEDLPDTLCYGTADVEVEVLAATLPPPAVRVGHAHPRRARFAG